MLVDQSLYYLAIEKLARFRVGQVVQNIVVKDVLALARQDDFVEVRVGCLFEDLDLLVDQLGREISNPDARVRDQLTNLDHHEEGEEGGPQAVQVLY